jgi:carbon monoxide dehydrogenase subunit G
MLIENEFTVSRPTDAVWAYLLDVEKVAPCMPGAELTETVDDTNWKGKVNMAFGPVKLSFAGSVAMQERDDVAHRVVLAAKGMEQKGKGAATANVTSWLEPADGGGTTVKMQADITLTGAAAQLSRGLLPEISKKLTQQVADCLHASMDAEGESRPPSADAVAAEAGDTAVSLPPETSPPAATPTPAAAKPVGGIGLGLAALWAVLRNFYGRLTGGSSRASS